MSDAALDRHAYLLVHTPGENAEARRTAALAGRRLSGAGWRRALVIDDLTLWLGPGATLPAVQVHRRHVLLGRWFSRSAALAAHVGHSRSDPEIARRALTEGWGSYLLIWRTDDGRLAILRPPAGQLDAVWWRRGGAVFLGHAIPECLDVLLPAEVAIDWGAVAELRDAKELLDDRPLLKGVGAAAAGDLTIVGTSVDAAALWRPGDFYRPRDGWDDRPEILVEIVDEATARLVEPHRRVVAEISGGLDSAIVSGSLVEAGLEGRANFLNFHDDRPEGDERRYARSAAERLGLELECVHKPVAPIASEGFDALGAGVRPGLHGLDAVYDAGVADMAGARGATGLLTGQGGDAVFLQAPDPWMVADRLQRLGLRGADPGYIAAVARWTRHSVWSVAGAALRGRRPADGRLGRRHPWLEEVAALPPAKAAQVQRIANARLFWGDCRRARAAELLHPLLSQPVLEHCLSIPTDILARGPRDRGLAREAFGARLPRLIADRRDKGDLSCFYGGVVRASAPVLRGLLLDGLLAAHGVFDPREIEAGLDETSLVRDPASNRFLILAVLETWARRWEQRLLAARSANIAVEPVEDMGV